MLCVPILVSHTPPFFLLSLQITLQKLLEQNYIFFSKKHSQEAAKVSSLVAMLHWGSICAARAHHALLFQLVYP